MVDQKKNEDKSKIIGQKQAENKIVYQKRFDKIYSRGSIKLPKLREFWNSAKEKDYFYQNHMKYQKNLKKMIRITIILLIAFLVVNIVLKAVEPMIDTQCVSMAKSIATKISNEQATSVMEKYDYEDLMKVTKDKEGNIKMLSSNMIVINQIISDIPILIQDKLDKLENSKFCIKLGSFTGSKILAGRGPDIEIKMSTIGHIETNLKSEFVEAGINQTLHRIYLEVRCRVVILTPFHSMEEEIINQVLLAEGVIVGNIPSTYYNLEGLQQENFVDVIE